MLNIFRGKMLSPNYRLVAPPNGEMEMITVHEEVSKVVTLGITNPNLVLDIANPAICVWSSSTKYQVHAE